MATYVTWPGGGGGGSTTALALKTTGADVDVSASAAPAGSGYVLVTTSATTCTWQAYTGLNLINNLRFDAGSNTTNTASVSSSGGGTTSEAFVLGKDSTITVTGAGSANNSLVVGSNTVVSATTGSIANSVFVGQGHVCASAGSDTSGAVAVGSAITVAAGATNSITLGHAITNGTPGSLLVAPGGVPSFLVLAPAYGNFSHTRVPYDYSGPGTTQTRSPTPAQWLSGMLRLHNGALINVNLPTGADLDAFVGLTQNLWVGMTFFILISKTGGAGACILFGSAGHTLVNFANVNTNTSRLYVTYRTGVNTWETHQMR